MKSFILGLRDDRAAFAFAVVGLLMIFLARQIVAISPVVMGVVLIAYALISAFVGIGILESKAHPGQTVIQLVTGIVVLISKEKAIGVLGICWAIWILMEVAAFIDEVCKTRRADPVRAVWAVISVALALMLMHDPFEHFTLHVRILGIEFIFSALMRLMRGASERDWEEAVETYAPLELLDRVIKRK